MFVCFGPMCLFLFRIEDFCGQRLCRVVIVMLRFCNVIQLMVDKVKRILIRVRTYFKNIFRART